MVKSKLDSVYRRLLITRFFEKGWGKPENLQRLFQFRKIISQRETCYPLVPKDYPVEICKEEKYPDCILWEGHFLTPLELHLPGIVPKEAHKAHFQLLLPKKWHNNQHKPICIHLAGTGDHYFWRRRNLIVKPLLKEANIGGIILENPFYGLRKPDSQVRSNLHNVSDIFVMGGCLILECLVLLHWCERNGFGPLGITGLSMGGHMASLAATNWPKPLVLVPCLSWSTAAAVFTTLHQDILKKGVMSQSVNWDVLETQYYADGKYRERLSQMVTIIDDAFSAGQKFIKHFNQSLIELKKDITYAKNLQNVITSDEFIIDGSKIEKDLKILTSNYDEFKDFEHKTNNAIIKAHATTTTTTTTTTITDSKTNTDTSIKNNNNTSTTKTRSNRNFLENSKLTKLMKYILPATTNNLNEKIDITKTNWWERETLQFMRGMMDECTHLKNFSVPYETSLIIAVCAKDDAYVPREGCSSLEDIWPGAEVRYLDAGHVSAYVLHQKLFRSCVIEGFERAKKIAESRGTEVSKEIQLPVLSYERLLQKYVNQIYYFEISFVNIMPPPRPKGVGCSTGIVSARPNPNTPMSERQQMALLIQMTASTTDHNRSYQKSKKFDESEDTHAHATDKAEVKEKSDELNVEKKDNNNIELNSGVGMESSSSSSSAANNTTKRTFSDAEDADDGDNDNDDVKRKRRKDSETSKDKQNANARVANRNEKNVKAHTSTAKSTAGSNKNCPTTDKDDGGGAAVGNNNNKNNKSTTYADVEGDESDDLKNDALYSGGLKVPPLKIVIPQQNCTIDTDGSVSRTGKVNTSRNAALPYVVSSNSDCNESLPSNSSPRDSPKVNNTTSTVPVTASTTPSNGTTATLEEKHGKLSNEEKNLRVLRSSHRSGLTTHERNSNNPSPSQMQSNSPSPASSSCTTEMTDNKTNSNSNYNNAPSSPSHPQNACMENENIVNLPSPSTSSTSSSKEISGNNVDLHPRKRKIRTKNEDQNKSGTSSNSNSNTNNTNTESTSICSEASTHDTPFVNCLQMYLNIRRQTDRNRKNVFPVKPRPPPQGFNEYLMNTKKYLLHTNQMKTTPIVPEAVPSIMKEIFLIQEKERTQLQQRHTVEREKLCLNVEQEILRVHSKAARSIAGQTLPFSVCTYIKDEEVYNMMALEQDEKDKNARHRFNGRLLISWLQDVDDKWEKIKESMILRHHNEAESLHAVQLMDWEIALKKNELFGYDTQYIVENEHVPIVQVEDFDLLPA